jgi:hypothetical protein
MALGAFLIRLLHLHHRFDKAVKGKFDLEDEFE